MEWIVSSSILIAAMIVGRHFLKGRMSCRLQYGLWLLAALRLLIPVSPIQSSLSVANLLPENRAEQSAENVTALDDIALPIDTYTEHDTDPVSAAGSFSQAADIQAPQGARLKNIAQAKETGGIDKSVYKIKTTAECIWLAGACTLALWLAAVNGTFRYKVRKSRRIQDIPESQREKRMLPVYMTDQVGSPCMYGLFCPAIYITPQVAADSRLLSMVLRHEQTHYRHGDHIWAAVRTLCLCIHWYNPLVWIAVSLSRQDGEMACDEGVLRQLGRESRISYGETLLALSAEIKPSLPKSMNMATSMSGTKRQLKERLSALVTVPRMAAGTVVLVILLFTGLAACTFTSRAHTGGDNPMTDIMSVPGKSESGYVIQDTGRPEDIPAEGLTNPGNIEGQAAPLEPGETESVYDSWDAKILWYYDEDHRPVAEVSEGETVIKLTYVETSWSLSAEQQPYSREIVYWACQALRELEQWTGTRITEVCYCVSDLVGFSFALTPEDLRHDRVFFDRNYNHLFGGTGTIEHINYSTDMDVWYSPVKQYVTPPGYDQMTREEILTWYFERSVIARGSKVEEIFRPWEGDYIFRTDQGTYYEFSFFEGRDTIGRSMSLYGPYDSYPEH